MPTEARILPKNKASWSFCGSREGGDNIINCKKGNGLKINYIEYVLGADHNGLDNLIRRMEHDRPFRKLEILEIILTSVSVGRVKHVFSAVEIFNEWYGSWDFIP